MTMIAHPPSTAPAYHEALLDAMQDLEFALAAPAPRRERAWCERAAKELDELHAAVEREVLKAEGPRGVFAQVEAAAPPLHHRIVQLKRESSQLLRQIEALETFIEHDREHERYDFREIRQRAGWLLTGLRHHTALSADLIFELYDTDIGSGD